MEDKVKSGDTVSVHYRGTLDDGTEFDSSHTRGEPLTFQVGGKQVIAGFDDALVGMSVGETKNVSIEPEQGYGPRIDEAIQVVPKSVFPPGFPFQTGQTVQGQGSDGQPLAATIVAEDMQTVTLDMNHPLAGKNLNFEIQLVSTA